MSMSRHALGGMPDLEMYVTCEKNLTRQMHFANASTLRS